MLKVQKDESIHSLILRTHLVNGILDFSKVITAKGGWVEFPQILKGTLHLYEPIDDLLFLGLLRDNGHAVASEEMFGNRFWYREDLASLYGGQTGYRTKQKNFQIRYCLKCMQDSIKKNGYGFFKIIWKYNEQCFEHNISLLSIVGANRKGSIEELKSVLRGMPSEKSVAIPVMSKHFYDPREPYHYSGIDYFSPCLEKVFKEFILANRFQFTDSIWKLIGTPVKKAHADKKFLTKRVVMQKIYLALKACNDRVLVSFMEEHVENTIILTGVRNKASINENIFKKKGADCQRCPMEIYSHCSADLSIIKPQTPSHLTSQCWKAQSTIVNNAYDLGLLDYYDYPEISKLSKLKQKELQDLVLSVEYN